MARQELSRLAKAIFETADGMHQTGIMDDDAHAKITLRYLGKPINAAEPVMSAAARTVYFLTHPDVLIDPAIPVPQWPLSPRGRDRMGRALALPWMRDVGTVWCSTERKARDGAEILTAHLGLPITELEELGENDRSATGYLPPAKFETMADEFFARPDESVCGWERAVDAQHRIVGAVETVLTSLEDQAGDVAIVAHGGVGALLLCDLLGVPVTREHDQPTNGGGNYFAFNAATRRLHHGWKAIDA